MKNIRSPVFVRYREICEEFNIGYTTLKYWRQGFTDYATGKKYPPKLTKGVHWIRLSQNSVLYNLHLIRDLFTSSPEQHKQNIERFLEGYVMGREIDPAA
jgi:hypothetical protein